MSTSTAGSTSPRPPAATRRRPTRSSPLVYFGSFQDLLGTDKRRQHQGQERVAPRDQLGPRRLRRVPLRRLARHRQGAVRGRGRRGRQEGDASSSTAADLEDVQRGPRASCRETETEFLPITTKAYLYLSGTPFKALATGEFIEEQIFNWTYTDEQRAKEEFAAKHPSEWNPYGALPEMRLLTYQMPDELLAIASQGEFDEFDLNEFFAATGTGDGAEFKHKNDVQKWLDIIRGAYAPTQVDNLKLGSQRPPFPYSDVRLLPYLQHSFWFLPNVAVVPRDGEPARREAERLLARLHGAHRRRRLAPASGWMRCRRSARRSAAASTRRPSRCRAASSPPASPCRSGRRS